MSRTKLSEERAALDAGTHEPAVDDFGNQYLARLAAAPERRGSRAALLVELMAAIPGTCDWGGCDNNAMLACRDAEKGWLPVCQWHAGEAGAAELAPITAIAFEELWERTEEMHEAMG